MRPGGLEPPAFLAVARRVQRSIPPVITLIQDVGALTIGHGGHHARGAGACVSLLNCVLVVMHPRVLICCLLWVSGAADHRLVGCDVAELDRVHRL